MRIMVADQDTDQRHKIVELITKWGHVPEEVLTGKEVVESCRKKCPDLIFVDTLLSGQPGIEIVRQIRQTGGHALWAPIVLMGKTISDPDIIQGVEAGADDVLQKPLSEAVLMAKVFSAARHFNLKEEVFKVTHELVVVNRALQNVVTQDVLTGIGNSSSFEEQLEQEWFKAKSSKTELSVILLNLDFFQAYNQTYGAEEGDKVIKTIAENLKLSLPDPNISVARLIGETFGVILPRTSGEKALEKAEKLRGMIEALQIPHNTSGAADHLTASFGVATAEEGHYTTPWDLMDSADFGLYKAKHSGRNRSVLIPATEMAK